MKRIQGIVIVFGLVGALMLVAQEVKSGKAEVVDLGKNVKLEMVLIPAGKFMMGSPESEKGRHDNERQHEVTLTKAYYIGKYVVTQEQWEAVMSNNPSVIKAANLPVTNVSWEDCYEFIKKLNVKTNGKYRLPTEAEWEYACRAGTTTSYSFGDKLTRQDVKYYNSKLNKQLVVGSFKPNAFGLYDMHGNVFEWCEDWHGEYPFEVTDPKGPATGKSHVLRGGSFLNVTSLARSAERNSRFTPTTGNNISGFRLARTP